ncbi:MAG TPA: RNA polymerase sigma-70 factor [Niabella sp.]|nr:RNA polymerase sigma-70 factor [Candidatus Woesebacteria bacterium]HRO83617.1 RNA polymerase sigma-70 factor [Niabella sp.]
MRSTDKINLLIGLISENSDQRAFEEFVKHYFPPLLSFSFSITKDIQASEEIVEDVFVHIWQKRQILPSIQNISSYLYISVKHNSLNHINSKSYSIQQKINTLDQIQDSFPISFLNPETDLISEENLQLIENEINKIPPKARLIFRLIKEDKMKYKEVASLLNISHRTVNAHLTYAIRSLSQILFKLFPEYLSPNDSIKTKKNL